jgi:hypothetical protein
MSNGKESVSNRSGNAGSYLGPNAIILGANTAKKASRSVLMRCKMNKI